jgi:polyhydroxyalkanoate synthesis regulator phasin
MKELEDLRKKKQSGKLTEEEERRLKDLKDEEWLSNQKEFDELQEKLRRGEHLTDEEKNP